MPHRKIMSICILGIHLLVMVIIWIVYSETYTKFTILHSKINLNLPNIHLIECSDRDTFTLKQLCVIESASKHHPDNVIRIWMVSHKRILVVLGGQHWIVILGIPKLRKNDTKVRDPTDTLVHNIPVSVCISLLIWFGNLLW